MSKKGSIYLELCKVVNYFFSNNDFEKDSQDGNVQQLQAHVRELRRARLLDILQHIQESNHMLPKLLPMKHFENVLFHSLSPYDFQLQLRKDTLTELFTTMQEHQEEIALMKPVAND